MDFKEGWMNLAFETEIHFFSVVDSFTIKSSLMRKWIQRIENRRIIELNKNCINN